MRTSLVNAFILSLLAVPVTSAPTPEVVQPREIQKRSFKVPRVRNGAFTGRNGPKALFKALRKHHKAIPPGLLAAMQSNGAKKPDVNGLHNSGSGRSGRNGASQTGASAAGSNPDCPNKGSSTTDSDTSSAAEEPLVVTATVVVDPNDGTQTTTIIPVQTAVENAEPSTVGNGSGSADDETSDNSGSSTVGTGNEDGKVTATPADNDVEYISPITIGGQTINVNFDSGSSDLWVFSTRLPPAARRNHQVFDEEQSDTFQFIEGAEFSIRYGDGSFAQGVVGIDTVDIGGATVQGQAVQLATVVDDSFIQDEVSNGLLGLAFSNINTVRPDQQKTFFDNIAGDLSEPVFTADLRPGETGAYEFGAIDESKFSGNLTFVPVNSDSGFWQFTSNSFTVGNGEPQRTSTRNAQAIADTGTTLIIADQNTVDGYYSQIQGARFSNQVGGVIFPCDTDLPDLTLDIENGAYQAVVNGEFINFAEVGGNMCFGGIQGGGDDLQIYGDIFFKAQFVVFNSGDNTIGFAPHVF